MKIPFFDLKQQYLELKNEIDIALHQILENQQFILGEDVENFEKEISDYCGADYSVGVSSGTDALLVALMALDVKPGDEIITSPYTFIATINCIVRLGAKPVFVDIKPQDFNLDPAIVERKITKRTRVIIPVHLFGQTSEMEAILNIAKKYKLSTIEDAAQSMGAKFKNRCAGNWGDIGCLSFFPTKNLGGYGDGGMIITNEKTIYDKVKMIRSQGQSKKYFSEIAGGNFRLDALQAKILSVKLKHLNKWIKSRRENACRYNNLLRDLSDANKIVLPQELPNRVHTYNQYVIRIYECRDELKRFLEARSIGTEIYYPVPAHTQPVCSQFGYKSGMFINSEEIAKQALALPIYPELSEEMQYCISNAIHEFFNQI